MGKREEGRRAGGARLGTAPAPVTAFERATQGAGGDSKANGRHCLPAPVVGVRVAGCPAFHGLGTAHYGSEGSPPPGPPPAGGGRSQTIPCQAVMRAGVSGLEVGDQRETHQEWVRIVRGQWHQTIRSSTLIHRDSTEGNHLDHFRTPHCPS